MAQHKNKPAPKDQPALEGEPLIKIEVSGEHEGNSRITLEMETLSSPPVVRLVNTVTGQEYIIPYDVASEINPELFSSLSTDLSLRLSEERIQLYHPVDLVDGLIRGRHLFPKVRGQSIDNFSETIILAKDEYYGTYDKYIPYLTWREEDLEAKETNGWELGLTGFQGFPVAFAEWNGKENIRRLANSMLDVEYLKALLTLAHPDQALVVATLDRSKDILGKCLNDGEGEVKEEIIEMLRNSKTLINPTSWDESISKIKIRTLLLENKQIAYSAMVPFSPKFQEEQESKTFFEKRKEKEKRKEEMRLWEAKSDSEREASLAEKRKILQNQWGRAFIKEMEENGWRLVKPFSEQPYAKEYEYLYSIWMTKLSIEEWEKISPALSAAVISG